MKAARLRSEWDIAVVEHECRRPDGSIMVIRVAQPLGDGPFPAVIDVHGGGWVSGDRNQNAIIDDTLARYGIVAAAPEFRMPPDKSYPTPIADVHLAIRWLKANAAALTSTPELVGGLGTSSGAHQLLECALRPTHPSYGALQLAEDPKMSARLAHAVACWPVADPLRRFQFAREKSLKNLATKANRAHRAYWCSSLDDRPSGLRRLDEATGPPRFGCRSGYCPCHRCAGLGQVWHVGWLRRWAARAGLRRAAFRMRYTLRHCQQPRALWCSRA
jgi:dienelactone hydrolase